MKEVHALVSGRVQGVGYRYYVRDMATSCGVTGWVRNNPDGTVTVSAVGEEEVLHGFLTAIRASGDPLIRVAGIAVEWQDGGNPGKEFEIRR